MPAMPTSAGTQRADVVFDRSAEAQIGDRDAMPVGFECRGDVFHAERLDAKEGAQPEAFVARNRPQQQNVHARTGSVTQRPALVFS